MMKHIKSKNQKRKIIRAAIVVTLLITVMLFGMYMMKDDGSHFMDDTSENAQENKVITIDGRNYVPRSNLLSYLFIGVDRKGTIAEQSSDNVGTGQNDVLFLLVIDKVNDTYALLPINRDTLAYTESLDDDNTVLAGTMMQIALAHASGDGREGSCENTVRAVSALLGQQKIDGYYAMNIDAIGIINHDLGGVTVTIEDDFSQEDSSLTQGQTITLNDDQAESFVRGRMSMSTPTNENRMGRQQAFLEAAKPVFFEKTRADAKFPLTLYDDLSPYVVTNLSKNDISRISKALLNNKDLGTFEIEGEISVDEWGFCQFEADESSLEHIIASLFYEEK